MKKLRVICILLIFLAGVILLDFECKKWRESFTFEEKTSRNIFKNVSIKELPQHHIKTLKVAWINGKEYRAFNPSMALLHGKMIYAYRISNYIGCPPMSGKAVLSISRHAPDKTIKSYIILSLESSTPKVLYLDTPDFTIGNCVYGFEDPRLIADPSSENLYVIANARSNKNCFSEMYVMKIPSLEIEDAFQRENEKLKVQNDQILKLRKYGEDDPSRAEKNWMPFFNENNDLLFVYGINPHIIFKCDLETGYCKQIAETYNPKINKELRGSSQARYYFDPITEIERFITVAHWRITGNSYVSQIYSFSPRHPYDIKEITPTFVIHDRKEEAVTLIQFVSGFEIKDDIAYISYGENDCDSKVLTIPMKNILESLKPV